MKNSLFILFFSVIALFACLTSCQKDDTSSPPLPDELPPITQTGEQTFGCLFNGEVWVPKHYSNSIVNPPVVLQASWDQQNQGNGKRFIVNAQRTRKDDNSPREHIILYANTDSIESKLFLDVSFVVDSLSKSGSYYTYQAYRNAPYSVYSSVKNKNSFICFSSFDTINRIASGTFSIDLLNIEDNQDTISIREGRFDVRF
jgi:hypothetical protein